MRPWVLLHGWGFHAAIWKDLVGGVDRAREILLVDLPGHGRATQRRLTTLDALADDVAASVPAGALVVGWSLGGLVAQRLARRYPDRVHAMALIASTPRFMASADWPHGVPATTLEAFAADLRADANATLTRFVNLNAVGGEGGREAARSAMRRLRELPAPSEDALASGLELLRTTDLRGEVSTLSVPAVVIHGARDRIVPVEAGRWLARTLPQVRLLELPAAAHMPFVSHREAVLEALEAFDG